MTSLDPTHFPDVGWKPQPRTRGEAVHEIRAGTLPIRALPDLRFEQSYLLSLKPFVHIRSEESSSSNSGARGTVEKPVVEDTALAEPLGLDIAAHSAGVSRYGVPERVEWGEIAWVTVRDQIISPLLQGALWGTASLFLGPLSRKLTVSLRELFVGPSAQQPPPEPTKVVRGQDSMGWLRSWDRLGHTKSAPASSSMGLLNEKEYEPAPPNLNLEQVHVYVRHGERTPVGIRMNEAPGNIPAFWNLCKSARRFKAAVLGDNGVSESIDVLRLSERGDGYAEEGECMLGELTDVGRTSSLRFGQALRKLYVEKLGFLPDLLESHETASTNMPRTIETLQQALHGLYPRSKIKEGFAPQVRTRHPKDENLIGNMAGCARLAEIAIAFNKAAAKENNPKLEQFDSKLSKYINGNPIRIDGQPRLSGIMDTVRAADAHGIRVPPEFRDTTVVNSLENAICDEWFRGYKNHEFRRLAMGRLLSEMSDQMTGIARGTNGTKIRVNACHDTTLAGLCTTLDVFDNRWPDFTASIMFELFSEQTQPAQSMFSMSVFARTPPAKRFVRMRYQNRNLALPACAAPGAHLPGSPEFCTLAAFQEHVRTLTPDDWDAECTAKGGKS